MPVALIALCEISEKLELIFLPIPLPDLVLKKALPLLELPSKRCLLSPLLPPLRFESLLPFCELLEFSLLFLKLMEESIGLSGERLLRLPDRALLERIVRSHTGADDGSRPLETCVDQTEIQLDILRLRFLSAALPDKGNLLSDKKKYGDGVLNPRDSLEFLLLQRGNSLPEMALFAFSAPHLLPQQLDLTEELRFQKLRL